MNRHLNSLFLLLTVMAVTVRGGEQGPSVDCVDTLAEFEAQRWNVYHEGSLHYSERSADLPEFLQGQLDDGSEGIFYSQGYRGGNGWNVYYPGSTWTSPDPSYFYVKYYNHLLTNSTKYMNVIPALYADDQDDYNNDPHCKYLKKTEGFRWAEEVVQVKLRSSYMFQMTVGGFEEDEYFLIEKMAVIQGHLIEGPNDVRRLCGWPEVEEPTTQSPPSEGVCKEVGFAPDPMDCSKYHVCQKYPNGEWWDTVMQCPWTTVWCRITNRCETHSFCPCPHI